MKGILFKPDMIKAIVEGRKTITRRLLNPQPFMERGVLRWQPRRNYPNNYRNGMYLPDINMTDHSDLAKLFSPYKVGEVVYIQETWRIVGKDSTPNNYRLEIQYRMDGERSWRSVNENIFRKYTFDSYGWNVDSKWRSSMFMPAWAARYFIKIIGVRAERLQEITPEDCLAEGISVRYQSAYEGLSTDYRSPTELVKSYQVLWDSINPKSRWETNPWDFVYTFKKVER